MFAIERAKKVIRSCETYSQLRVAKNYAIQAVKQIYGEGDRMWESDEMRQVATCLEYKIKELLGEGKDEDGKS